MCLFKVYSLIIRHRIVLDFIDTRWSNRFNYYTLVALNGVKKIIIKLIPALDYGNRAVVFVVETNYRVYISSCRWLNIHYEDILPKYCCNNIRFAVTVLTQNKRILARWLVKVACGDNVRGGNWSSSINSSSKSKKKTKTRNLTGRLKQQPQSSCCISKNVFGAKRIMSADNLGESKHWRRRCKNSWTSHSVVLFEKRVLF